MEDYLEDCIHPDGGSGWENWQESIARKLLQKLGCNGPPIHSGYFKPWLNRETSAREKKPQKSTPRVGTNHRSVPVFPESDLFRKAARLVSANFLKMFGPPIRPDHLPEVLDQLSLEIMAPKSWLETCWTTTHDLKAITADFPCLSGENLAIRLARFWNTNQAVTVGWFQGGQRIWTSRGGEKGYGSPIPGLEMAAWSGTREYSRPVILREPGEEAYGIPFHQGFPKGEVIVHWRNGFHGQSD